MVALCIPEEIETNGELIVLIQHKGDFYKATTIEELEKIVSEIKEGKERV